MQSSLVVLTGASGSGKTTLAHAFKEAHHDRCDVFFFDSIGVPSSEEMKAFGEGHEPGGAWQRAMTLQWMKQIAGVLQAGRSVLFEGQMRIAFIIEALNLTSISMAHVILVDCDDATRTARLTVDRHQPELANADMMGWARYLRQEAMQANCEIMNTGITPFSKCIELLASKLRPHPKT